MPPPDQPGVPEPTGGPIVLASRSPRRRKLLGLVVPPARVRVVAPADPAEEPLDGLTTWRAIEAGLLRVAAAKREAVRDRIAADDLPDEFAGDSLAGRWAAVIAADTAVVAGEEDGALTVLGQPPPGDWEATFRRWFRAHLVGRTHAVLTAVAIAAPRATDPQTRGAGSARTAEAVVKTRVTVRADAERHLDRLIAAGEPVGRAGGLAIGGLFGALVVERVEGSLSNVSGLPLRETLALLRAVGVEL